MRYSRLIAFLFSVLSFGWIVASGQTPGTSTSQAPAATRAPSPAQPPAVQSPQQNPLPNLQPVPPPNLEGPRRFKIIQVPRKKLKPLQRQPDRPLDPQIDQGIYLRTARPTNGCGAIVSYNFSLGDNPQLESITTCTPSDAVRTLRTQDKDQKPEVPLLQRTNYSTRPKQ